MKRPKNHPFLVDGKETTVKKFAREIFSKQLNTLASATINNMEALPGVHQDIVREIYGELVRLCDRTKTAFKYIL